MPSPLHRRPSAGAPRRRATAQPCAALRPDVCTTRCGSGPAAPPAGQRLRPRGPPAACCLHVDPNLCTRPPSSRNKSIRAQPTNPLSPDVPHPHSHTHPYTCYVSAAPHHTGRARQGPCRAPPQRWWAPHHVPRPAGGVGERPPARARPPAGAVRASAPATAGGRAAAQPLAREGPP
ncbi:MAG: hypothetical protein J3K34DRAFT_416395 [Monoraphidium minutum]|nr:MAG: hypothetical protein J3K34DRAFT_416395 [Monoraphidium minutum]